MMGSFSGNMSINHSNIRCFVSTSNTFMGQGHLGMFMIMTVDMPSHFKSDDFKIVGSLNFITTIGKWASIMGWMSGIKMLFQKFRTLKFLFTNITFGGFDIIRCGSQSDDCLWSFQFLEGGLKNEIALVFGSEIRTGNFNFENIFESFLIFQHRLVIAILVFFAAFFDLFSNSDPFISPIG